MDRRDLKNRLLLKGEQQKKTGKNKGLYEYRYKDQYGELRSVYSWRLTASDPQLKGKQKCEPLRDMERKIEEDLHDEIDTYTSKKVTLNERFDLYMSNKKALEETTRNNYVYMYNHCVKDEIGKLKLCDINSTRMKKFYMDLVSKRGYQPATVDNIHTFLNPVFDDAVDDNIIRNNPCTKARKEVKNLHGWSNKNKIKGLTCSEQRNFVDFMLSQKCFARWVNVITVLLGSGMRISELRGLCWEDVSFEKNQIYINKQLVYRQWEEPDGTKRCYDKIKDVKTTAAERVLEMEPKVREALLAEKERQKNLPHRDNLIDGYSNWVFLNRYGLILSAKSVNDAIDNIIKKYNSAEKAKSEKESRDPVYLPHQTNHMLRHSYCTRMIEKCCEPNSGITVKVVQYLMGHEDIKTTLDIYTDVSEEFAKKTMSNLAGEIYLG